VKTTTTLKEALEKIKQLKTTYYFKRDSEHVSIPYSVGRELREDIVADYISPEFDISAMDGFAFRCEDNYPQMKFFDREYNTAIISPFCCG
jgi:molybdopterin biosynthesis enzyme